MQVEDFFQNLYMDTYQGLYQYIRRITNSSDAVEDILQETYFEAYKQQVTLLGHENPQGWLYKTAGWKFRNYMRQHELQNVCLDSFHDYEDFHNQYTEIEWKVELQNILSEKDTALFYQYYVEGFTGKEISASMGISEECLKVRVYRMKKKIRNKLQCDINV